MTGLFCFNDMLQQKPQTRFSVCVSAVGKSGDVFGLDGFLLDTKISPWKLYFLT